MIKIKDVFLLLTMYVVIGIMYILPPGYVKENIDEQ